MEKLDKMHNIFLWCCTLYCLNVRSADTWKLMALCKEKKFTLSHLAADNL